MLTRLNSCILTLCMMLAMAASPAQAQTDLYVVHFSGNKVTRHDAASGALLNSYSLTRPTAAEIGPDGNLYTVGYDGDLRKINPNTGAVIATLATDIATFPDDLNFGPDGNIYIACEFGPGILRYDVQGHPLPSPGNTGAVFFFGPANRFLSTAFDKQGNVYASDFGANQVFKFSPTGSLMGAFVQMGLDEPNDMRFGPDGNLYVCNRGTNDVRKFDGTTGAPLGVFASADELNGPESCDFGPDGNLYVASRNDSTVARFEQTTGEFIDTFIPDGLNDPVRVRFFGKSSFQLSGISPRAVKLRSGAFQMRLTGIGFGADPKVKMGSATMHILSKSDTSIVIDVPAKLLKATNTYKVTVVANGEKSNAVPFRVTNKFNPKMKIGPVTRTGKDPATGVKYAVLLLQNIGVADITNLELTGSRLYFDSRHPTLFVQPVNITLERGASPPGTFVDTPPGYRLQVRFDFPPLAAGNLTGGTFSVQGTSNEGPLNVGKVKLVFPP
jgi:streptogramin lyase